VISFLIKKLLDFLLTQIFHYSNHILQYGYKSILFFKSSYKLINKTICSLKFNYIKRRKLNLQKIDELNKFIN
jgi:hypothetical protein